MVINESDSGLTTPARTIRSGSSRAGCKPSTGRSIDGVTCTMCGNDVSDQFPGQSGSVFSCTRCKPSGGGITKKVVAVLQESLNSNRR